MVRSLFSTAYLPSFDTVTRRSFSRQRSKEIRPSVKIASEAAGRGQDGARKPRSRAFEVATSGLASLSRLPFGTTANAARARDQLNPELFPRLYEFEACPFCRRVREAITDLDLDVIIFPCPKGSLHHRSLVIEKGGKELFPFLEDPNSGISMYESADIVEYLYEAYGAGAHPPAFLLPSTFVTGWIPSVLRAGRGASRWEGAAAEEPAQPLELWNYEGNQFARLVREALCELELPYIARAAGKGSPKREELRRISGATQVPYIVDPNTGVSMAESGKIVQYLFETYKSPAPESS